MANKGKFTFVTSEYNESKDEGSLIICDSQLVNNSLTNPSVHDDFQYEINSGVQYRLVGSTTTINSLPSQTLAQQSTNKSTVNQSVESNSNTLSNPISEMVLLNELQTNRPCVIYPKTTILSDSSSKKTLITGPTRKRDEARRATHNEVERRRRDKINLWIDRLRILLPDEVSSTKKRQASRTSNDSKSAILIRACEYIRNIKDELENLKMCLNDIEEIVNLKEENNFLRSENEMLHVENEKLKEILSSDDKTNITKIDSPTST